MSEKWFENIKSEVNNFIKNASDVEIEEAFTKANYEVYKNINIPIIEHHYDIEKFLYKNVFRVSIMDVKHFVSPIEDLTFDNFSKADEYHYSLAA
ncbi:MAG TPA: hypothetical protein VMW95_07770 [Desulfobacterales bacterium]|nr:hypothetical protein [Desulfobacterales bacterium]